MFGFRFPYPAAAADRRLYMEHHSIVREVLGPPASLSAVIPVQLGDNNPQNKPHYYFLYHYYSMYHKNKDHFQY